MCPQPVKKSGPFQKPRSKTVRKRRKPTISEVIKRNIERSKKPHPKYGTSKLEVMFESDFLKKLGVRYERQFYAKDIKRYYDFYLPDYGALIEEATATGYVGASEAEVLRRWRLDPAGWNPKEQ